MQTDDRIREYILPQRILWQAGGPEGGENLLRDTIDQAAFRCPAPCRLPGGSAILLDFGREYAGGAQLIVEDCAGRKNARMRLRFGESAMECMAELGEKGATNDHSVRDEVLTVPWAGMLEYGNTGFRFLRIDNLEDFTVTLAQVKAVYVHGRTTRRGRFFCDDSLLNEIYETGVRTLELNMQHYVYDGVKRDRHVWIGDMHPESSNICRVFGAADCVPRSLDFVRANTPPDRWMNDIPSYSLWWLKIHRDWYRYTGDLGYFLAQADYCRALLENVLARVRSDGSNDFAFKFIDWPSSENPAAQDAGLHALLVLSLDAAAELMGLAGDGETERRCREALARLRRYHPDCGGNKQAAALLVYAGLADPVRTNEQIFRHEPLAGVSAFLGHYLLQARGMAGDIAGGLELVRRYYGGMVKLGATTFWEDFDLRWAEGARPIDALLAPGEYDVHGDNGGYCYRGYRHSLCHGWSTGPIAFLTDYLLGVRVLESGCRKLSFAPNLGDLTWLEGVFPTPLGDVAVRCEKRQDGSVYSEIAAPDGVRIERN